MTGSETDMGRGLSQLQRRILAILKTKELPDSNRTFFTTDEIISEISFDYALWVKGLPPYEPFFGDRPRSQQRLRRFEPLRVSAHRALQNLEKRGLVVSYFSRHSRWWAVPERIKDLDMLITKEVQHKWVEYDKEYSKYRRECWKHGGRVRRLKKTDPELWVKYRLGIADEEEIKKIRELWNST